MDKFAQLFIMIADEIRPEGLQAFSKAFRTQQEVKPPAKTKGEALVLVTMGSDTDLPVDITSAHGTPAKVGQVGTDAAARGIEAIIAAAGGAARLPSMLAADTPLPAMGVPVKAKAWADWVLF
ncbi:hypothetical protein DL765_006048 [Monosporascus sp. GIB2]|nr:hypothetical protein DL765_006048 [Monosporascus sp. GIB2]